MPVHLILGLSALGIVVASGIVWFKAASALRLPHNRGYYVAVWLLALGLAIAAFTTASGWLSGTVAVLAGLGSAFFLMTFAISRQTAGDTAITPGADLPVFSAPDETGEQFQSATLAGQPLLLKFFRGHW